MRPKWLRSPKWRALVYGGLVMGWLQGLEAVNFADLFTRLLSTWLTILVTALFGGDVSQFNSLFV